MTTQPEPRYEATLACGDTISRNHLPRTGAYCMCIHCEMRHRVISVVDHGAPVVDEPAAPCFDTTKPGGECKGWPHTECIRPPAADIPADILEQLETDSEFLEAARQAAEITSRMAELRSNELAEAREAAELADRSWQAAEHAVELATDRLAARMTAAGVIRTAAGFELAPVAEPVTGPASAEIDADGGADPGPVELRLGGRAPGLYVDGKRVK